jgi:COP9 signalosome complex subunit 1
MGNEDLANHFFAIGDLPSAFKAYSRMRDYCTTPRHIAELTMKQLHVSVAQSNWVVAQSYFLKVQGLHLKEDERAKYEPILHACLGLANLQQGSYREAANSFLNVAPSYMNPEIIAGINFQREVISPNDIAIYGGLTALATMDRTELQRRVLDNSSFRQFLELESHLRRAISMFCAAKYTGCMAILESYRTDYMLDLFLQDHFMKLYWMVRGKSIVQWFSAFSVVTLDALAKAFPTLPEYQGTIEQELGAMIRAGRLKARIDLVDRLLISPDQDARFAVMENSLRMAKQAEKSLRLKLHKVNMTATGLDVKSPKNQGQNGFDAFTAAGGGEGASSLGGGAGQAFRNLKGKLTKGGSGLGLGGGLTAYMS